MSFVTTGCGPAALGRQVKAADPFGPDETFQLVSVDALEVGGTRLAPFAPGLIDGSGCLVVLGSDVLKGLALDLRVGARTVTFRRSAKTEDWLALVPPSEQVEALPITHEPRNDWPLMAVQVRQGDTRYTTALLFSGRESRSRLYEGPAREAGLKQGLELLQGLPIPEGVTLPKALDGARAYLVDSVELAPGFGVGPLALDPEAGAPPHSAQGVLGADVWARFDAIIDVDGSVLVLHRPRVLMSGSRAQCERGGAVTEEACFEVHSTRVDGGVEVSLAVWRPLPAGAHVTFDLEGTPSTPCRVGVTFSPMDRGASAAHLFPWTRLREVLPDCGAAMATATAATPGLFEEGGLPGCPGTCAFAIEVASGRMTCECQPTRQSLDETEEQRLLDLYREALKHPTAPAEHEPADPN